MGISQRGFSCEGSVGKDLLSYGFIGNTGDVVHNRVTSKFGKAAKPGDTVGFVLSLYEKENRNCLEIFVNGISQGIAFNNVTNERYYPTFSMYYGGRIKFNSGPTFEHYNSN